MERCPSQPKMDCFEPKLNPIWTVFDVIRPIGWVMTQANAICTSGSQLSSIQEKSCAKCGIFARFQSSSNTTHGVWAHVQRKLVTFPRELVRRIGMKLYYLNSSDFARPEVLLGSLGLIIFEMGRPLTCTETGIFWSRKGSKYSRVNRLSKVKDSDCYGKLFKGI
jgi:hypothetical protein